MAAHLDVLCREIQREIDDDPSFASGVNISVMPEKKGSLFSKKEIIVLSGSVRNEIERKRVEEIAHHRAGDTEVVINLKITR